MVYSNYCPYCSEEYISEGTQVCVKCGFPFNGKNEIDKEYIRLFALFYSKTTEELEIIINSNEYTDVAKDVALDIKNSDRKEYNEKQNLEKEEREKLEVIKQEKNQNTLTNPLYDDVHQMAEDIRYLKDVVHNHIVVSRIFVIIAVIIYIVGQIL